MKPKSTGQTITVRSRKAATKVYTESWWARPDLQDTRNPKALDATLQQIGGVLIGGPDNFLQHEGHYVVRPLGGGFVRFACETQGYATVVGDAPNPAPWDIPGASQEEP